MLIGFCHDHALILYVYLANGVQGVEESVLTVCTPYHPHLEYEAETINAGTVLHCLL